MSTRINGDVQAACNHAGRCKATTSASATAASATAFASRAAAFARPTAAASRTEPVATGPALLCVAAAACNTAADLSVRRIRSFAGGWSHAQPAAAAATAHRAPDHHADQHGRVLPATGVQLPYVVQPVQAVVPARVALSRLGLDVRDRLWPAHGRPRLTRTTLVPEPRRRTATHAASASDTTAAAAHATTASPATRTTTAAQSATASSPGASLAATQPSPSATLACAAAVSAALSPEPSASFA